MKCETCNAPAVLLGGACVFCRTPIDESHAPIELLTYLQRRLPMAKSKRFGVVRRGEVRDFDLDVDGRRFRARVQRGQLIFEPDLPPARWVDALLAALSAKATGDAELRTRLSRAGWDLR